MPSASESLGIDLPRPSASEALGTASPPTSQSASEALGIPEPGFAKRALDWLKSANDWTDKNMDLSVKTNVLDPLSQIPSVHLPSMPTPSNDVAAIMGMAAAPGLPIAQPIIGDALQHAIPAVYNQAIKPLAEFMGSPAGVATLAAGGSTLVPAAVKTGISAYFSALGANQSITGAPAWWKTMNDPQSSAQDKWDSTTGELAAAAIPALAALPVYGKAALDWAKKAGTPTEAIAGLAKDSGRTPDAVAQDVQKASDWQDLTSGKTMTEKQAVTPPAMPMVADSPGWSTSQDLGITGWNKSAYQTEAASLATKVESVQGDLKRGIGSANNLTDKLQDINPTPIPEMTAGPTAPPDHSAISDGTGTATPFERNIIKEGQQRLVNDWKASVAAGQTGYNPHPAFRPMHPDIAEATIDRVSNMPPEEFNRYSRAMRGSPMGGPSDESARLGFAAARNPELLQRIIDAEAKTKLAHERSLLDTTDEGRDMSTVANQQKVYFREAREAATNTGSMTTFKPVKDFHANLATQAANANPVQESVGLHGNQSPGPAPQVAEGKPSELQVAPQAQGPGAPGGVPPQPPQEVTAPAPLPGQPEYQTNITNSMVDQERAARGQPPLMSELARSWKGTVWPEAMARIEKDPAYAPTLVSDLVKNPRPVTDTEDAVLAHRKVELMNESRKTQDIINNPQTSPAEKIAASVRQDALGLSMTDLDNVTRAVGRRQGQALAARNMLINEDFSVASMQSRKAAANMGQLTEADKAEINATDKALGQAQGAIDKANASKADKVIAELERKIRMEEPFNPTKVTTDKEIDVRAQRIADLREQVAYLRNRLQPSPDLPSPEELRLKSLEAQIARVAEGNRNEAPFPSSRMPTPTSPEITAKEGELAAQKEAQAYIRQRLQPSAELDQKALDRFRTATAKKIADLNDRLAKGDFSPKVRNPIDISMLMTDNDRALAATLERTRNEFRKGLVTDRMAQRASWEKVLDILPKIRRAMLLLYASTLGKLSSAAVLRTALSPMEEGVGSIQRLEPIISRVAAKAPRHGAGLTWAAEKSANFEDPRLHGWEDIKKTVMSGQTDRDVLYGRGLETGTGEVAVGKNLLDIPGRIHGAMKAVVKGTEETRSTVLRQQYALAHGQALTPEVEQAIGEKAYRDGLRAIFLQDNSVADSVKRFAQHFDAKARADAPVLNRVGNKLVATAVRGVLPIVKVPTNVVAEAMEYGLGQVLGRLDVLYRVGSEMKGVTPEEATAAGSRIKAAIRKGIESMPEDEADMVMRMLKKGALGPALLATGYFGSKVIGGFYEPGQKRPQADMKPGEIEIGGTRIAGKYIHHPLTELLQFGATVARVGQEIQKGKGPKGKTEGLMSASMGLAEDVPVIRQMFEMGKLRDPSARGQWLGDMAKGSVLPGFVQESAQHFDKDSAGHPIKRNPSNIWQSVESGIPGLRQEVPAKPMKPVRSMGQLPKMPGAPK